MKICIGLTTRDEAHSGRLTFLGVLVKVWWDGWEVEREVQEGVL